MKILGLVFLQILNWQHNITSQLTDFQNKEGIKGGTVSFCLMDVDKEEKLLGFNEEKSINPASTLKLISTGTALEKLGADFRFETDLMYTGQIFQNKIVGDLLILPHGDPSLASSRIATSPEIFMKEILDVLKLNKIDEISGQIIIYEKTYYSYDTPDTWIWGDMGNYYGAGALDFNFNENLFKIYFDAGNMVGSGARFGILDPFDADWQIINQVKTGEANSGDQVYIYTAPFSETLLLKGTVPLGAKQFLVKGSISMPFKVFAKNLTKFLNDKGVKVDAYQENQELPLEEPTLLKKFYSPTLAELVRLCNHQSINLYADAFLKKSFDSQPNLIKKAEALKEHLKAKGLNTDGTQFIDGSGLSMSDYINTQLMANYLVKMPKSPIFSDFYASIPRAGFEGSVRYFDRNRKTNGRLKIKSGSIDGSRTYAGYYETTTGKKYAFMIGVNRYEKGFEKDVRVFMENILVGLVDLDQY